VQQWAHCELHPFGCGNSLVLNQDDWGIGLRIRLRTTKMANKLACYIIGSDGSDGCCVGFMAREYAVRDNGPQLDGAIIEILTSSHRQREPLHVLPLPPQPWLRLRHCFDLNNCSDFI
jgi:hypothetical protein